jgi:hypothetical protein
LVAASAEAEAVPTGHPKAAFCQLMALDEVHTVGTEEPAAVN